ncbi:hypothetical protein KW790_00120 [Candidatus Parcubacteria bacterium]|nr:hypothetical protein [Candidatus Parcubacteria bacterium]
MHQEVAVQRSEPGVITLTGAKDSSPFSTIGSGLASSFTALRQGVKNVKARFQGTVSNDIQYGR